jgi:hypothetical protein
MKNEFTFPIPNDYLDFLTKEDFTSSWRKYFLVRVDGMELDDMDILEISDWFTHENIPIVYNNCLEEGMIEKFHLPIFDSYNCTIVIDCNEKSDTYGYVYSRTPEGYFDEDLQKNVYIEFDFVAKSFSEIINNLKTEEELEDMGIM